MDEGNRPPIRRFYRQRRGQMLGGLAAGLADYLQVDVSLVRLAWIVLAFITGGAAAVAYLIAWIVVPEEPAEPSSGEAREPDDGQRIRPEAGAAPADESAAAARGAATESPRPDPSLTAARGRELLGWGLLAVGLWVLLQRLWNWNILEWRFFWPTVLILIGLGFLLMPHRSGDDR